MSRPDSRPPAGFPTDPAPGGPGPTGQGEGGSPDANREGGRAQGEGGSPRANREGGRGQGAGGNPAQPVYRLGGENLLANLLTTVDNANPALTDEKSTIKTEEMNPRRSRLRPPTNRPLPPYNSCRM